MNVRHLLGCDTIDLTVDRYAAFKSWKTKRQDYTLLSRLKDKDEEFQSAIMCYTFSAETRNVIL